MLYRAILTYYFASVWQGHLTFDGKQLVRDIASSLCPYTGFCHTNASTDFKVDTTDPKWKFRGIPTPCCEPCYCTDDCWELGNCCPDKRPPDSPPDVTPCLWSADFLDGVEMSTKLNALYYRVINDCPVSFDNKTIRAKCNGTARTDLEDFIWVSDQDSGKIFQNKHCSMCHDVDNIDIWQIETRCRAALGSDFDNWKDILFSYGCYIINVPPQNQNLVRKYECFEQSLRRDSAFISCNQTGLWEVYDSHVEYACLLSTWPYFSVMSRTIEATNVFCSLCNRATNATLQTTCHVPTKPKTSGTSFSILLNYKTISIADASSDNLECKRNEIMDEYKVKIMNVLHLCMFFSQSSFL